MGKLNLPVSRQKLVGARGYSIGTISLRDALPTYPGASAPCRERQAKLLRSLGEAPSMCSTGNNLHSVYPVKHGNFLP